MVGDVRTNYQVAQLSCVLGTLLIRGTPLVPALETAGRSLDTRPLSESLSKTGFVPGLSLDMMEVGESTGALLASVAEFYDDDVASRLSAPLSMIELAIMRFE